MQSKHGRWWVCGAAAGAAVALIGCLAVVVVVWALGAPPEFRQALGRLVASPTSTATASPTPTSTLTSTPTPSSTPTVTPSVTPVLLDAPSPTVTSTPRAPSPTASPALLPAATSTPSVAATRTRTATATDTAAPPEPTPAPAETATPDASSPTPQPEPFLPIGSRAVLSPQSNGVVGTAVLFSGREFTMINFSYDGQCPAADIRVGKKGFPKPATAVLAYLEARPYRDESIAVPIAPDVPAGSADAIFVYCDTRDEMMAWGEIMPPR